MTKVRDVPQCAGCPMLKVDCWYENTAEGKVHFVGGENEFVPPQKGPSDRLVIGSSPHKVDGIAQRPMSGGAANWFDSAARKAGIQRDRLTIINTVNCCTPNNLFPTSDKAREFIPSQEAAAIVYHCFKAHVEPVLQSRDWERIDAVGEEALRALTGKTDGIMKWRGSPLPLKGDIKPKVVSTWGCIDVMRNQYALPDMVSDLKKGTQLPPERYNLRPIIDDVLAFRNAKALCFDIETNRFTEQITMVGLSVEPFKVTVVPMTAAYIEALKSVFASAESLVGQNIIGFDIPRLFKFLGLECTVQIWDIMLMQHLLQPDAPHDLEYISSIFTQKPAWKHLSSEDMPLYCARDVDTTLQSFLQLKTHLVAQKLEDLYKFVQVPLQKICTLAQETGITVDGSRIAVVREQKLKEIEELEKQLPPELAPYDRSIRIRQPAPPGTVGKSGKPVKFIHIPGTERVQPWNSDAKVKEWLYKTKGYPVQKNSKTNKVSSDKKALAKLLRRTKDPAIDVLMKLSKLTTLVSGFLKETNVARGKVHTHLSVVGTNSGRLSSANPNMQNQPAEARYIYVPSDPEWCLVEADFSSGENRLTALYANDHERLRRLATPGFNEHKYNASIFFGIPIEEIIKNSDPDQPYTKGKKINHGLGYGEGPRKIAQDNDLDFKEVQQAIDNWRRANPLTVAWQERTAKAAARDGVLTNAFSRRRWFWTDRTYTESLAFLPQSTLADIIFRAMIGLLYERINWPAELAIKASPVLAPLPYPARFLLQVHDSLLVETPKELVPQVVKAMKAVMEQSWSQLGGYVIPCECKVGEAGASWGEVEPYKE